ncbi:hypothetical protein M9H77_07850 [Catharanthus roseus]|uniref:Uncharacterized protein n=1 Tax=Catharanthus roseus TaxID=4058 RepID=A0ACC0BW49_CATRO|nr:hypothetical protein M9H77_07850 [Catharanthus roseus]
MAQVKDATERVNVAEGKIARLNIGKAKLDEIIYVGRRGAIKSGLAYTSTNLNHTTGMYVTQHESSYTKFGLARGCSHPVHHFIDELTPIAVLPALTNGSSINQFMEDIDEGLGEGSEGEHIAE